MSIEWPDNNYCYKRKMFHYFSLMEETRPHAGPTFIGG
jgi:hypothetical protein